MFLKIDTSGEYRERFKGISCSESVELFHSKLPCRRASLALCLHLSQTCPILSTAIRNGDSGVVRTSN
ncbi:hypothetical protein ACN38_g12335 [Penicillium nordicum]|uniref:Uncharacterized protein n=1 Tax=Penicillium nordicum TaxID=229535 RepID=A0A0M8NYF0_9EURO|nr:hypothetical protein ACN38_g12335 [Penicillium nordicum]